MDVDAATASLPELIALAATGEEILIARGGEAVVRLTPLTPVPRRQFGLLRGLGHVGPELLEPPPDDELRRWEGDA